MNRIDSTSQVRSRAGTIVFTCKSVVVRSLLRLLFDYLPENEEHTGTLNR